eukprot:COSAG01_NODE_655_length_14476_cov_6.592265_1_plen_82_part_00
MSYPGTTSSFFIVMCMFVSEENGITPACDRTYTCLTLMDTAIGSAVPANVLNINCVLFLLSSIQHLCGSPCGAIVVVRISV